MDVSHDAIAANLPVHGARAPNSPYRAYPLWSLLGIIAGGVAADVLIPEYGFRDQGALMAPGFAAATGLLLGVVVATVRSPASLFRTEHLLMIGLVFWVVLDAAQGAYALPRVSHEAIRMAFFSVFVFAAFLWVGSIAGSTTSARIPGFVHGDIGIPFLFWGAVLCFTLGMQRQLLACDFSPQCLYNSLFAPRFSTPWHEHQYLGLWTIIVSYLRYLGFLVLPLAVALAVVERRLNWRVAFTFVLGLIFLLFLVNEGGRRNVGAVIVASAFVWLLLQPSLNYRHMAVLALVAALVLLTMQAMIAWRNVGIGTGLVTGVELTYKSRSGVVVDKNLHMLAGLIDHVPEQVPYTGMSGVLYTVSRPIPGSIWPGKPERGIDLPRLMGMRMGPGFSWTMSAVGDLYLIGGLWVVAIGGFLYGMAANLCNRLLNSPVTLRSVLIFSVATMTLFVSLRAMRELVAIGFVLFGLWGVLAIRRWLLRTARPAAT